MFHCLPLVAVVAALLFPLTLICLKYIYVKWNLQIPSTAKWNFGFDERRGFECIR